MAKEDRDWTPDTEGETASSASHPKNRDQLIQEHRQRRIDEPAAAPQTTDAETGDARAPTEDAVKERERGQEQVPRKEPANTYNVVAGGKTRDTKDVRAGPGDAGASDTPDATPEPAKPPREKGGQTLMWIGIGLAAVILLFWLF